MLFKNPPETARHAFSRVVAAVIAPVLGLALCSSIAQAQTLQLRYTFEDTGTATDNSGALGSIPLTIQNFAGTATDLHGATGSGVQQQGKALDLSSGVVSGNNGPVAQVIGNSALGSGLGIVSNFTASIWFKQETVLTNTGSLGPRLFILGANGVTDHNSTGQSISMWFENTNAIFLKLNNGPTLAAPIYYNPLPTNVWLFVAVTYDGTNAAKIYFGSEASPAKLLTIRSIGVTNVNFGASASLMIGNRNNRGRVLDGWIDDFRFYTGDGDAAFIEGIRQASTPLLVTGLAPDGSALMQGTNTLSFNASSANGINTGGIKVAVDGVDVSGGLVIGGTSNNRTVSYSGLPVNPVLVNNAGLNAVRVSIQITDLGGIVTTNVYSYDAFSPTNFTVEAEDYNYGNPLSGSGGLYIDNPRYAFEEAGDTYWQREGVGAVDYEGPSATGNHVYRGILDNTATEFSVSTGGNGGPSVGELMRQKVLDALSLSNVIREVNVGNFDAGEWQNYTRTYPVGPYNVFLRVANGGGSKVDEFYRVTGDTTQPGQGTNLLGSFSFANTGGWQSYAWVPLRDPSGNLVRLDLAGGVDTFRVTATAGGGGNLNLFMFAPANTNLPVISGIYPNGTNMFQPSPTFSFVASSPSGTAISSNSILVTLTRTTFQGTVVTNLTRTNGLTITGNSTNWNVSTPLITNAAYTAVLSITDVNGGPAGNTVKFDTYNPTFTWEAEDYNYGSGQIIAEPQTNGYAGLAGTTDIDYFDNVLASQNGTPVYRTADPVGLEVCGDTPLRHAYIGTGFIDYDVGWYDNGNWNNYTRTLPSGDYNVLVRAANGSGGNGGVTLARVTSDATMAGQTTTNLGTFTIPATGGWQTYTWVPLRDGGGNLVKFTTGGTNQTLRATSSGGCNANFYALIPANTNLPTINNIYPNGAALFQKTNTFSFTVASTVGVNTNSIIVNLDGVILTNLTFSGTTTSRSVSYLGLTQNTNHTATISVTDINGNSASTSVTFDTFSSSWFTWEAEDYDFGGGFYTSGVDAYLGLSAVAGVDFLDVNLGGVYNYRPDGTATDITSDLARAQFAGTNDYHIGFFGTGEWGNYTRQYPAGNYNVWGRFAAGGGDTAAQLSSVTSGWGTTSQTTNLLGTFNIGTSSWTTFTWVPLRDNLGNLVKAALTGSTNTLKLANAGPQDVNVNFLMLVPTPGSVQLSIVRNGANADVSFLTQLGLSYQLQYKNAITDPSWTSLGGPLAGDGSTKTVSDPLGTNSRFYRLWIQQP